MAKKDLLKKHQFAIDCAVKYYVECKPTGISDSEFDRLEKEALMDGICIRDIALSKLKGNRIKNQYIESFPKEYSEGSMYDSILKFAREYNKPFYIEPKYDGSGVAAYYEDGIPVAIVTCGGSNKSSDEGGIDQTKKLQKYFPMMDSSIKAIQCEVLVPMDYCERPRQLSNGILNSKDKYSEYEIDNMICIRGFRYFSDNTYNFYDKVRSFNCVMNPSGTLFNFAPGHVMDLNEVISRGKDIIDKEYIETPTGNFLIDGYVLYSETGNVIKAIKFKNAGGQEGSEVDYIQWNDLTESKDGFSSNVILKDPIDIRGSLIKKPSSNGVKNLLNNNISKGAIVSVTLRGSTIPCVDKVFKPGNGDFNWPVCKCGTQLGPNDIYRNNLKCPNPLCTSRINRMIKYIENGRFLFNDPRSYTGLFLMDGYKFEDKLNWSLDFSQRFKEIILNNETPNELLKLFINNCPLTNLQRKNLELVIPAVYESLRSFVKFDLFIKQI